MTRVSHRAKHRRSGYTLIVVIVLSFIVTAFAAVMSKFVLHEWRRDGRAILNAHAEEVLASVRAWRETHRGVHLSAEPTIVTVDGLLPAPFGATASLALLDAAGGARLEVCEVRVEGGYAHVTRRGAWPAPSGALQSTGASQPLRGD